MDDNSLCKQALNLSYNLSADHKTSFYSSIQTLLTEYNLPVEIIRQNRISINQSQNIKNKYIEFWQDKILLSDKLSLYSNIKKSYYIESYLELKNVNQKKNITKLRTSSHNLMIEKGRYLNLNREERLCPFCPNKIIEAEIHFLFICPLYKHLSNDFFTYMSIQCQLELTHLSITDKIAADFQDSLPIRHFCL